MELSWETINNYLIWKSQTSYEVSRETVITYVKGKETLRGSRSLHNFPADRPGWKAGALLHSSSLGNLLEPLALKIWCPLSCNPRNSKYQESCLFLTHSVWIQLDFDRGGQPQTRPQNHYRNFGLVWPLECAYNTFRKAADRLCQLHQQAIQKMGPMKGQKRDYLARKGGNNNWVTEIRNSSFSYLGVHFPR